jgi:hypothetical protein
MEDRQKLAVAYRIYPGVSKVPPVHSDNKYELTKLCLSSFRRAIEGTDTKIWFILDACPDEYVDLINSFGFDDHEIIRVAKTGNAGTFGLQLKLLSEQDYSENIYFAEDDYFYLDGAVTLMLDALTVNKFDFASAYDHPDYYELKIHDYPFEEYQYRDKIWRTSGSTCMTFLTTKSKLTESMKVFKTYTRNNYDSSLWLSLTKKKVNQPMFIIKCLFSNKYYSKIILKAWLYCAGHLITGKAFKLWSPAASLATHMDSAHLARGIDWYSEFRRKL